MNTIDARYQRLRAEIGASQCMSKRSARTVPTGLDSRHVSKPIAGKPASMPAFDNAAISEARTIYPSTVIGADEAVNLLVSGINHWKLGSRIKKGKWRGYPIFALTLQERATCPTSCRHFRSCFGNSMNFAKRVRHGPELEARLVNDVAQLQARYPRGFALRIHVLGDFYSIRYVRLWEQLLDAYPALHVFGFSARHDRQDPIAVALIKLVMKRWDRFAIRFSNAPVDECSTVTVEHPGQVPSDAVLCPQQTGKTENCASCAFCWQSKRRLALLQH